MCIWKFHRIFRFFFRSVREFTENFSRTAFENSSVTFSEHYSKSSSRNLFRNSYRREIFSPMLVHLHMRNFFQKLFQEIYPITCSETSPGVLPEALAFFQVLPRLYFLLGILLKYSTGLLPKALRKILSEYL